jgi:hypothetical protein
MNSGSGTLRASEIEIRSTTRGDIDRILGFYRDHFPDAPLLGQQDYFEWRFRFNHSASGIDNSVIALDDGKAVGFLGLVPDSLWDGAMWHDARWCVNLLIDPACRGGLTVLRMFQHAMRWPGVLLATGAGPHMLKLYQSLGWVHLPVVDTFYFIRRPTGLYRWVTAKQRRNHSSVSLPRVVDAISRITDVPISRFADWRASRWGKSPLNVQPIQEFRCVQSLLEKSRLGSTITTGREPDYLLWKAFKRPVGTCWAWRVAGEARDPALGYVIAKPMSWPGVANWMEVVDLLAFPSDPDFLSALFHAVLREAARWSLDFIRVRCSLDEHRQWFRSHGWIRKTMPVSDDIFCYSRDSDLLERVRRGPWHFTSLVSDRADYGRDEWPRDHAEGSG